MSKTLIYSLEKNPRKGIGARLHDILNAYVYCKSHDAVLKFIEDEKIPYFAQPWSAVFDPTKWLCATKEELETCIQWPTLAFGSFQECDLSIQNYASCMHQLFTLDPDVMQKVEVLVAMSGFDPSTDLVVHLRLSDKVKQVHDQVTFAESAEQDPYWYWNAVEEWLDKHGQDNHRVFICTDDPEVFKDLPVFEKNSKDIPCVYDEQEVRRNGYCPQAFRETLKQEDQLDELYTALKNWVIMQRCKFLLVGARASYFFRIGELLHEYAHPNSSKNVKDSDMFGKAEYAPKEELQVRPCQVKCYLFFVNTHIPKLDINKCRKEMKDQGMTTIHNIILPELAELLYSKLRDIPKAWIRHSIKHQAKVGDPLHFDMEKDKDEIAKQYTVAKIQKDKGLFAYSFKRSIGSHFPTCICAICRLSHSIGSFEFLEFISDIVGERITKTNETFMSNYEKGDFLSVHADVSKGSYAFVFSFNKNWNPCNGGLLHFINHSGQPNQQIYHTVIPSFNTVTIFRVNAKTVDHFVTEVTGDSTRISYTGWLS